MIFFNLVFHKIFPILVNFFLYSIYLCFPSETYYQDFPNLPSLLDLFSFTISITLWYYCEIGYFKNMKFKLDVVVHAYNSGYLS
jgi:hypothetical protein